MRFLIELLMFTMSLVHGIDIGSYIGCYKIEGKLGSILNNINVTNCIQICERQQNKYAAVSSWNSTCFCSNFLGELSNFTSPQICNDFQVYYSKDTTLGPPRNLKIIAQTDENVVISWNKPDNLFINITSYEINATVLETFAQYPYRNTTTWVYSNYTFQTALTLQPGSKYNLSIAARSDEQLGKSTSIVVETTIGAPDNLPAPPQIISRNGSRMVIKINPVVNNNGPVTFYRVIVLNLVANQIFQMEYLGNFQDSVDNSLNYYITAELTPEDIRDNFIVGDGKYYGNYFNAPLIPSVDYNIIVGIVSVYKNTTKSAYSSSSRTNKGVHVFNFTHKEETSFLVVFLTSGIVILSILLIVVIVIFAILRKRVNSNRHNRLSEQELTLQGPMISVENSAYLPDDEQTPPINYYQNLKQKVRILNLKDELSVDAHSIIGKGKFGTICNAILRENNEYIPLAAYSIPDKNLEPQQKKLMLKHLDMLIKCGKHENLIELIGTSESSHMLYVVFKIFPTNLKQFLLNNRILIPNRFFKYDEIQILHIVSQIINGLSELENQRIYHSKLCARNIMLTDDLIPKISGFGLADFVTENEPDYTRWTALEILKGGDMNSRSPIWSFGVLLWEICALGATPYNNISNSHELIDKILKGTRLPQLKYFNDDVYQIMLSCWQIDMGERPDCRSLSRSIENLYEDTIIPFVSFNLYQTFEYEQYNSELEFKMY